MSKRQKYDDRKAIIDFLQLRDGNICWLCKTIIIFWPGRHNILGCVTIDHLVPVSCGGGNEDWNMRLAHYACNSARGNLMDIADIEARIADLFVNGEPATRAQRRERDAASKALESPKPKPEIPPPHVGPFPDGWTLTLKCGQPNAPVGKRLKSKRIGAKNCWKPEPLDGPDKAWLFKTEAGEIVRAEV